MTHNPHCTGCPECNAEFAAVMKMNSVEYARVLTQQSAKLATALGIRTAAELRTAVHAAEDDAEQLRSMAAFRESFYTMQATARTAADSPATSKVHLEPEDPYAAGIAAMQKERR